MAHVDILFYLRIKNKNYMPPNVQRMLAIRYTTFEMSKPLGSLAFLERQVQSGALSNKLILCLISKNIHRRVRLEVVGINRSRKLVPSMLGLLKYLEQNHGVGTLLSPVDDSLRILEQFCVYPISTAII